MIESLDRLDREVREVYRTLVLPTWGGDLHGLPDALYGYMMGVFAKMTKGFGPFNLRYPARASRRWFPYGRNGCIGCHRRLPVRH